MAEPPIASANGTLRMVRTRVQSSIVARRWSPEEDALLDRLFREGKDLDEIAARLKRTIASVQRRVSDLRAHSAFRDLRTEPSKLGR
jgi:DNA-binding NarL/FixJ family response regulator